MVIFRQISWWLSRESVERKRKCCGESSQQSERGKYLYSNLCHTNILPTESNLASQITPSSFLSCLSSTFPTFPHALTSEEWLFLPCVSNNFKVWIGLHFQHIMMRMLDYLNITDFICNASSHIVHLTQLEQFLMSPCKTPTLPHCNAFLKPWRYNAS